LDLVHFSLTIQLIVGVKTGIQDSVMDQLVIVHCQPLF